MEIKGIRDESPITFQSKLVLRALYRLISQIILVSVC